MNPALIVKDAVEKRNFSKIQQEFFHELREYQRKEIVQNRDHDDELEL